MKETFIALRSAGSDDGDRAGLQAGSAHRLGLEPAEPVYVARVGDPLHRTWLPTWEPTYGVGPDGCALPPDHLEILGIDEGEPVLLWSGRAPGPSIHVLAWTFEDPEERPAEGEDLLLLLDSSGSMADGSLRAARRAIHLFVDSLRERSRAGDRDDRIGLVTFGGDGAEGVRVPCPLERDRFDEVVLQAEACEANGLTPMGHALEWAAEILEADPGRADLERRARIVLLSDGYPDEPERAREAAERLRQLGVRIATVGVGIGFDVRLLATLAARTGGPFLEAARVRSLTHVLEELSR